MDCVTVVLNSPERCCHRQGSPALTNPAISFLCSMSKKSYLIFKRLKIQCMSVSMKTEASYLVFDHSLCEFSLICLCISQSVGLVELLEPALTPFPLPTHL